MRPLLVGARKADDLAAPHGEADVLEVLAAEAVDLERDGRVGRRRAARRGVGDVQARLLAGHGLDQPVLRQVGDRAR